jgi:tRNA A-37 threonylcarbamoyl transferase component Bud32
MPYVEVNPVYYDTVTRLGLLTAADFLGLAGPVITGHPDRHVARVRLAEVPAILKREHRVRWRTRWANAFDGFGRVSRSAREALTLRRLREAGVGCPEWVAHGEDDRGRAFLLVRELTDTVELRQFVAERSEWPRGRRYAFARRLGSELARVHQAGVNHPDLYAKHVLVRPADEAIFFLDWQRSRWHEELEWPRRLPDLAALDATLTEAQAACTDRLVCLQGYLAASGHDAGARAVRQVGSRVRGLARQALRKRHVRAERQPAPLLGKQGVLWLDGEALCVTSDFWEQVQSAAPDWVAGFRQALQANEAPGERAVALPGQRQGRLVTAAASRPFRWLWAELRGKPLVAPEVRQAGLLFQHQLRGEPAPRLLAFGQRRPRPWRTESFLLTEAAPPDGGGDV